jgi:hypothetical protein
MCAVQVVLSMKRRATMAPLVSRVWKWFEISSGKWCPYGPQQNKAIDQAFWAGEQSLKITSGRRKYNIQVSHPCFLTCCGSGSEGSVSFWASWIQIR